MPESERLPRFAASEDVTTAASRRLEAFLRAEIETLPAGHAWRAGYTGQLVRLLAQRPELAQTPELSDAGQE